MEMKKNLDLHCQFVLVLAEKAGNSIVFVCKAHYINGILEELGFNSPGGNPTLTHTLLSNKEILQTHFQ